MQSCLWRQSPVNTWAVVVFGQRRLVCSTMQQAMIGQARLVGSTMQQAMIGHSKHDCELKACSRTVARTAVLCSMLCCKEVLHCTKVKMFRQCNGCQI